MHVRMELSAFAVAALMAVAAPAAAAELAGIKHPSLNELQVQSFTLPSPGEVSIEGQVLASDDDWLPMRAWLLDSAARKVVWEADGNAKLGSDFARLSERVRLPAGDYELYLATFPGWRGDDRRSFDLGDLLSRMAGEIDRRGIERRVARVEVVISGDGRPGGALDAERLQRRIAEHAAVALIATGNDADRQAGFALDQPLDVRVSCLGEARERVAYDAGWIENADTGEKVWRFEPRTARPAGGAGKNRLVDRVVRLAAGRYVARFVSDDSHSFPRFNAPPPDDPAAWGLVLRASDPRDAALIRPFDATRAAAARPLVALVGVGDDEHRSAGLALDRPIKLRVRALGEGVDGEMVDRGWILDAATGAVVWEMRHASTAHAGGGEKNREVDEVLDLGPGRYVIHYASDGSHSAAGWNSAPPFERRSWGIRLFVAGGSPEPSGVSTFDPVADTGAIAAVVRVGDDARRTDEFTLERPTEIVVLALGEADGRGFADRGWIEDVDGGRVVWEMRYADSEHAGGARKNRLVRARMTLPAGRYRLVYVTDGSHAYGSWNASPPLDPDAWGISVYPAGRLPAEAPPSHRPQPS